uniref:Uncharacterized protein n=1 Tax=Schistocephalus solidus TaxID=70667 RepID=A0A0V0JC08_SCHSO
MDFVTGKGSAPCRCISRSEADASPIPLPRSPQFCRPGTNADYPDNPITQFRIRFDSNSVCNRNDDAFDTGRCVDSTPCLTLCQDAHSPVPEFRPTSPCTMPANVSNPSVCPPEYSNASTQCYAAPQPACPQPTSSQFAPPGWPMCPPVLTSNPEHSFLLPGCPNSISQLPPPPPPPPSVPMPQCCQPAIFGPLVSTDPCVKVPDGQYVLVHPCCSCCMERGNSAGGAHGGDGANASSGGGGKKGGKKSKGGKKKGGKKQKGKHNSAIDSEPSSISYPRINHLRQLFKHQCRIPSVGSLVRNLGRYSYFSNQGCTASPPRSPINSLMDFHLGRASVSPQPMGLPANAPPCTPNCNCQSHSYPRPRPRSLFQ